MERRGQAIRVVINLVNWQQEEPHGYGGGRQLSMDGTSRVTGDCHARFCERLGVKFPGPTRRRPAMVIPTATIQNRAEPVLRIFQGIEHQTNTSTIEERQVWRPKQEFHSQRVFVARDCPIQIAHAERNLTDRGERN